MREGEGSQMDAGFLAMSAWREAEVFRIRTAAAISGNFPSPASLGGGSSLRFPYIAPTRVC